MDENSKVVDITKAKQSKELEELKGEILAAKSEDEQYAAIHDLVVQIIAQDGKSLIESFAFAKHYTFRVIPFALDDGCSWDDILEFYRGPLNQIKDPILCAFNRWRDEQIIVDNNGMRIMTAKENENSFVTDLLKNIPDDPTPVDDYFGLCPVCHQQGRFADVDGLEIFGCDTDKVFWIYGDACSMVLDSEGNIEIESPHIEDCDERKRGIEMLKNYQEVKPYFHPMRQDGA